MKGFRRTRMRAIAALAMLGALSACGTPGTAEPKPARSPDEVRFTSLAPDVYRPCGISPAPDAVWVVSCTGKAVRIGRDGDRVARSITGEVVGLDSLAGDGSGSLWVLTAQGSGNARTGAVVPLDATAAEPGPAIDLGASIPMHITSVGGKTWVAAIDGTLFTLDGRTARRVASGPPLLWVFSGASKLWTVAENGDVVERAADGSAARTFRSVLPNTIAAAADESGVWLAAERGVVRLDTSTGRATRVDVAGTVNNIEACGASMWLSQPDFGVRSVDASGATVRSVRLESAPSYVACDGNTLWIIAENGGLASIDVAR